MNFKKHLAASVVLNAFLAAAAFAGGAIDVHSHVIPADYLANLQKHNALLDEGFPLPKWDVSAHLKWMDEAQVQTSILTLAAPQPYFGDATRRSGLRPRYAQGRLHQACNQRKGSVPGRTRTGSPV